MTLPVAILAGGLATRLRPETERIPKSLIEVAGKPFAVHQIELLSRHGLTDIVFLVGHLGEELCRTLGNGSRWGVRLRYVFDGPRQLGTGGAVCHALPELGDVFFVLYGDSYLLCDYGAIEQSFAEQDKKALMTVCRNQGRWDRSNVLYKGGAILAYDKRAPTADMQHIDYGLGVFRRTAFDGHVEDEALDLMVVYQQLLARDDLAGFEVPGRFYEIGSPEGLRETREYLATHST